MKKLIIALSASILLTGTAQSQTTGEDKKTGHSVSIGTGGITIDGKDEPEKPVEIHVGMLDVGINTLHDKTDYSQPQPGLRDVPAAYRNENLYSLRQGKSTNVNIYPVLVKVRLMNGEAQRIYFSTGVGLQLYNFAFNKPVSYLNNTTPSVFLDTVSFSKNKLKFNYLTVPLSLTFKTRLAKDVKNSISDDINLVYGFGVTAGYRLDSWTKQVSNERGQQKNHDAFNFRDYNFCLTGELGIDNYFRLYATYQLTSLEKDGGLQQHPICIGVRFFGI